LPKKVLQIQLPKHVYAYLSIYMHSIADLVHMISTRLCLHFRSQELKALPKKVLQIQLPKHTSAAGSTAPSISNGANAEKGASAVR